MPHDGSFVPDFIARGNGISPVVDISEGCSYIVHVVPGIYPAGEGKPDHLEPGIAVLPGVRITVCQQGPDLNSPDPRFEINLQGQCLADIPPYVM